MTRTQLKPILQADTLDRERLLKWLVRRISSMQEHTRNLYETAATHGVLWHNQKRMGKGDSLHAAYHSHEYRKANAKAFSMHSQTQHLVMLLVDYKELMR